MKMVIGGNNQGQLDWAKENYEITEWTDGKQCDFDEIYYCAGVFDFQQYVYRIMKETDCRTEELVEKIIRNNPKLVIVSDEIGYGLVPIDSFDRKYREETGRICTKLAAFSNEVVRVVMGIGVRIKG